MIYLYPCLYCKQCSTVTVSSITICLIQQQKRNLVNLFSHPLCLPTFRVFNLYLLFLYTIYIAIEKEITFEEAGLGHTFLQVWLHSQTKHMSAQKI